MSGVVLPKVLQELVVTPNDLRISCRRSCWRPHKPSFLIAPWELAARAECCAHPACRLHARVRLRRYGHSVERSLVPLDHPGNEQPHRRP